MSDFCGLLARADLPATIAEARVEAMLDAHGRAHAVCRTTRPAPGLYLGFASLNAFHHEVPRRGQVTAQDNLVVFGDISVWQREANGQTHDNQDDVTYLHGWLRKGRSLASVNGDFCGGALDQTTGVLTLFRDHIGMRSVYYTQREEGLWFASNLRFFQGIHAKSETLDPLSLAAYSVIMHPGQGRTYFKDVHQIKAAHQIRATADGPISEHRYWSLETSPDHGLKDVDQAVDHVREKLEQAVAGRIGDAQRPGTALSGGLDSTSVTAMVAKIRGGQETHCFSHRAPNPDDPSPEWADWPYMQEAVREIPGLRHHVVTSAHIDVLAGTDYYFHRALIPSNDLFFHGTQAIYEAAIEYGVDVCVDGMFGDYAFSIPADPLLVQALMRGNISLFLQEYRRRRKLHDGSLIRFLRGQIIRPLIPVSILKARYKKRGQHWSQQSPLKRAWKQSDQLEDLLEENGFSEIVGVNPSMSRAIADEIQYSWVPQLAVHQDYVDGDRGVRIRNPLADIGLLQALYWAPYTAFASPDHDRSMARHVGRDLLPPKILARDTKDEFTPSVFHRLMEAIDQIEATLSETVPLSDSLYDHDWLITRMNGIKERQEITNKDFFDILLPHAVGIYLRNLGASGS
ncbi:MAG: asparagine synthase-related protein [Pseudomonadota bacterium]